MFDEIPVLADVYHGFLIIVFGILVIMFLLSLLRLVMGPSVADRVLAVNMLGGMVISAVAVLALILNETYLFDISLIYALLSFLAAIVLAQIYIGVYRERNAREERERNEKAGKEDAANGCS